MRVTKEHVEPVRNLLMRRGFDVPSEHVRDALEAALAPLPEPVLDGHDCDYWRRNYAHAEEECTAEREMARELEAKLARVRAVLDDVRIPRIQIRSAIRAILDGEP